VPNTSCCANNTLTEMASKVALLDTAPTHAPRAHTQIISINTQKGKKWEYLANGVVEVALEDILVVVGLSVPHLRHGITDTSASIRVSDAVRPLATAAQGT
jgi:hypothetical protein